MRSTLGSRTAAVGSTFRRYTNVALVAWVLGWTGYLVAMAGTPGSSAAGDELPGGVLWGRAHRIGGRHLDVAPHRPLHRSMDGRTDRYALPDRRCGGSASCLHLSRPGSPPRRSRPRARPARAVGSRSGAAIPATVIVESRPGRWIIRWCSETGVACGVADCLGDMGLLAFAVPPWQPARCGPGREMTMQNSSDLRRS